ncbi:hypothetical protein AKJ09_06655 [Labilithrix luteola]|uniref:Uncharacterized protein n=1 Tax=Labilithrix luteola TaxID=1391654 RepID=A0A0K1Q2W6_9BACT|nr:hypothetical protein AKJ09_06655 [Labilithrix luteola]
MSSIRERTHARVARLRASRSRERVAVRDARFVELRSSRLSVLTS